MTLDKAFQKLSSIILFFDNSSNFWGRKLVEYVMEGSTPFCVDPGNFPSPYTRFSLNLSLLPVSNLF